MKYVINLSTSCFRNPINYYGYWTGKTYRHEGEVFPVCEDRITLETKRYTSKKRAENMAEKLLDRCDYVVKWEVESVED